MEQQTQNQPTQEQQTQEQQNREGRAPTEQNKQLEHGGLPQPKTFGAPHEPTSFADAFESADESSDTALRLDALAEKLGIEPKDVYERLHIPMGEGQEPLSLGKLKDAALAGDAPKLLEREHGILQREQEVSRAQADLSRLINVLSNSPGGKKVLTDEVMQVVRQSAEAEQQKLQKAVPELADGGTLSQVQEFARGFSHPLEIALRFMQLQRRVDAALGKVKQASERQTPPSRQSGKRSKSSGTRRGSLPAGPSYGMKLE